MVLYIYNIVIIIFQIVNKVNELEGNIYIFFCKKITTKIVYQQLILIKKNFALHIFLLFCLHCRTSRNLFVKIFDMLGGTSLSLISYAKNVITTKTITSKKAQATHANKGDDHKIVITQSTHSTSTSLMTCSKVKSTTALSVKLESEHTHLPK